MYIIRGWLREMARKMAGAGGAGRDGLKDLFPADSFALEFNPERY